MASEIRPPPLEESMLNLKLLREASLQELRKILESLTGRKYMIIDPCLIGCIGQMIDIESLKKQGVAKLLYLESGSLLSEDLNDTKIVYILRPKVRLTKVMVEIIRQLDESRKFTSLTHHIYFVPQRRLLCETVLQDARLLEDSSKVTLGDYHLYLVPVDSDLLTMDLPKDFKDCSLDGDRTSLFYTAKALMQIQSAYGFIPNVYGKGNNAMLVAEMLDRMRREKASRVEEQRILPEIDTLILLDREVDLITPLCTQLTYEGLVDEAFGIFNSTVLLPAEMVVDPKIASKEPVPPGQKFTIQLNCADKLFQKLRNLNFSVVGPELNKEAVDINTFYKKRKTAESVQAILDFKKELPVYQKIHSNLRIHTNITESLINLTRDPNFRTRIETEQNLLSLSEPVLAMNYIEESINKQEPLVKVLRLLVLYSLTNDGIEEKKFNNLKRDIVQTYGYKYLYTLDNLNKLGMFKIQKTPNLYPKLKEDFKLFKEETIEPGPPKDISYIYSGYAPLSVRLIEKIIEYQQSHPETLLEAPADEPIKKGTVYNLEPKPWKKGWGQDPVLNKLVSECPGGVHFSMKQTLPKGISVNDAPTGERVVLVFYIGGCTFGELAAIRFLTVANHNYDFLVTTTKMVNGNTLIESLIEKFEKVDEDQ